MKNNVQTGDNKLPPPQDQELKRAMLAQVEATITDKMTNPIGDEFIRPIALVISV